MIEKSVKIATKIAIYDKNSHTVDDIIYYRGNMSIDFALRWKWWFRYLAARVQVSHPRRKVEMFFGRQNVLIGDKFKEQKTKTLLNNRRGLLKRLENDNVAPDLFGFNEEDKERKLQKCKEDIRLLEQAKEEQPYIDEIYKVDKDFDREIIRMNGFEW